MIGHARFHRGCNSQCLVNAAEVVVHEVERDGVLVILNFLGKSVRQTREPAHSHSHRQILAFDVTGGNVSVVRLARHNCPARAHTLCGAVTGISLLGSAVNLHQLGEVDFIPEGIGHGFQIGFMAVSRQLDAMGQPSGQVMHEVIRCARIARSHVPAWHQLGFGVQSNPSPNVASAWWSRFREGYVLRLSVAERPNLVTLEQRAVEAAENTVLINGTRAPEVGKQGHDSRAMDTGHSRNRPKGISLDERGHDSCSHFGGQLVHEESNA